MKFYQDLVIFLFGLSGCFWIIYGLYVSFRIEKFIVKRYEQETDLLETVFFKEHATFTRWIPDFFSSAIYTSHLSICLWAWRIYNNRKIFRDIENPIIVTRHFSQKEIGLIKWFWIGGLMFVVHGIVFYALEFFWPELL